MRGQQQNARSRRDFSFFFDMFFPIFSDCLFHCANFSCVVISTALIFIYLYYVMHIFAVSQGHESRRQRQRRLCGFSFYFLSCSAGSYVPYPSSALFEYYDWRYICSDRPFIIHLNFCVFVMFGFECECVCVCRAPLFLAHDAKKMVHDSHENIDNKVRCKCMCHRWLEAIAESNRNELAAFRVSLHGFVL